MKRADGALLLLLGLLGVAFSHAQLDRPNNGTGPIAPILNLTVPIFNTSYFMNITSTKLATTAIKAVIAFPEASWAVYKRLILGQRNFTTPGEDAARFNTFKLNAQEVLKINTANLGWVASLGPYAHLNTTEFLSIQGTFPEDRDPVPPTTPPNTTEPNGPGPKPPTNISNLIRIDPGFIGGIDFGGKRRLLQTSPVFKDWRMEGKVTPVKNQGACGSCWAFAAVGAIESKYLIRGKGYLDLSEEQLVDCVDQWHLYQGWACSGGYASEALRYAKNNRVTTEAKYPYQVADSDLCLGQPSGGATAGVLGHAISNYARIADNRDAVAFTVAYYGPVVFSFRVVDSFRYYSGGIYSSSWCDGSTNHAMVIVGYNKVSSGGYWIVKNSWGPAWGEGGYARIRMTLGKGMCRMYSKVYRVDL